MGFRKRAMTKMIQAKVDYDCREYLIGHKRSRGLNVHYDRTSETERFMEWSKSINLLTIDPTHRLEKENQELKSTQSQEIARLKWREGQQAQEIADLRLELKEVQSMTAAIGEQ